MNPMNDIKEAVLAALGQLTPLLDFPQQLTGREDSAFGEWTSACETIQEQLSEDMIRVAVVGAIKSGKSTFINSLLAGDYLKRGAGVVTAIVTRIRHGRVPKAKLFFKSWDQVNSDIANALVLLPNFTLPEGSGPFDIRREPDRNALAHALSLLNPDQMISRGTRNANAVLLGCYLKGFDQVENLVSTEPAERVFEGPEIDAHRRFAGEDAHAVYLTDIELEIDSPFLNGQIEIADCQGSDSSNPLHLAMIQDYLNLTHLIVYVISSRTGIRQADIKFLSMIKKMGILDHILFVINCDFSEHSSLEDMRTLIERTTEELALLRPEPKVFAFSALYNLFGKIETQLPEKDRLRFANWRDDTQIEAFSNDNSNRFNSAFENKTTRERQSIRLGSHLDRMERILAGMRNWVEINQQLLARGGENISQIGVRIQAYQDQVNKIRSLMKTTLEGALSRIKKEMKRDVDHLFGGRSDGLIGAVVNFIKSNHPPLDDYAPSLTEQGFRATMYQVFQDFRQSVDAFMAESISPQILGFLREKEGKLADDLASMARPYDGMIQEAMTEFSQSLVELDIPPIELSSGHFGFPDVPMVKHQRGISYPPAVLALQYSMGIKTDAVFHFGYYSTLTFLRRIIRRPPANELEKGMKALERGLRRIRQEMERTILSHFLDYKENIKFQYIIKLADALSDMIRETLLNRFQSHVDSLVQMVSLIDSRQLDEAQASNMLADMMRKTQGIESGLDHIRQQIGMYEGELARGG
jgi:GTPase SAR1 family protein